MLKVKRRSRQRNLFIFFVWLFIACKWNMKYCSGNVFKSKKANKSITETELAEISGYIVFVMPLVWESLIFQTYVNKRSKEKALSISKKVINENIQDLTKITKIKDLKKFKKNIEKQLKLYEKGYIKKYKNRNNLFLDTCEAQQKEEMQKKSIEPVIHTISNLSQQELTILIDNIKKLIFSVQKDEASDIWSIYENVINKALQSMENNTSVNNSLDITIKEFNTKITQFLLKKETNKMDFNIEKARFNLGGAIYTPSLLKQIAGKLNSANSEDFVQNLVHILLKPVVMLKSKTIGYTPENMKEEIIKYIKAVVKSIEVYSLRKQIDEAQNMRSQSICKRLENMKDKQAISQKIDTIQLKNTQRMLDILQEASPALFVDFIIMDKPTITKYAKYIKTGGGDERLKKEIETLFNLR